MRGLVRVGVRGFLLYFTFVVELSLRLEISGGFKAVGFV